VKYERLVHGYLRGIFPQWCANQWIQFSDDAGPRWCQPDGYVDLGERVLLVEVKYQHTPGAWEQLRLVYAPLLEYLFGKPVAILEIVKWYDPLIVCPEPVELVASPAEWAGRGFGVHIWRP